MPYACDAGCNQPVVVVVTYLANGDSLAACDEHAPILALSLADSFGALDLLSATAAAEAPVVAHEAANGAEATNGAKRPKRGPKAPTAAETDPEGSETAAPATAQPS